MESKMANVVGIYTNETGREVSVCDEDENVYNIPLTSDIAEQLGIPYNNENNRAAANEDSISIGDVIPQAPQLPVAGSSQSGLRQENRGKKIWTSEEIKCLLQAYKEERDNMLNTSIKNDAVWEVIASKMQQNGFPNNWSQCKFKFNNLKRKYTTVKDNNNKSGAARMDFAYMEQFEELFQKDHSITPLVRVESSRSEPILAEGSSSHTVNRGNEGESEDEFSFTGARKRRKTVAELLLQEMQNNAKERQDRYEERKAEREAEREIRNQQHREVMAAISRATDAYKESMDKLINKT